MTNRSDLETPPRWRRARSLAAAASSAVVTLALAPPALALQCPAPQPLPRPGVLKETPAQISELSRRLAAGDVSTNVAQVASQLRARYPGVQTGEIVNYLITAYCPVVEQMPGLSEAQRQARMDEIASTVTATLYSQE
jgi:hypothetical protein